MSEHYLPDGRPGYCRRPVPMDQLYFPMMAHESAVYVPPTTPLQRLGDACYALDNAFRDWKRDCFWRRWHVCYQAVQAQHALYRFYLQHYQRRTKQGPQFIRMTVAPLRSLTRCVCILLRSR